MDQMEFDRTRKAIDVKRLKEDDRKEMLQKLHEAGGEILPERSVNQESGNPEKDESRGVKSRDSVKLPSELAREQNRLEQERKALRRKIIQDLENSASSAMSRFFIRLKCKLKGIASFNGHSVNTGFMSKLNLDLKQAVMECHIIGNDLFASNPEITKEIIKQLDQQFPIYAELIERGTALYDRQLLSDLTGAYMSNPDLPIVFEEIRLPLYTMVRKLYYLRPFQESYLKAIDQAIQIQQTLEKKSSSLYSLKRKKIRTEWNFLMNDMFPQLVLLIQRIEMKQVEPYTILFDEIIGMNEDEKPGRRKTGDPLGTVAVQTIKVQKESSGEAPQAPVVEKKEEVLTDEILYGIELMNLFNLNAVRNTIDKRNDWGILAERDKVLQAFLYLRVFESEFSFVLSSPKVQINSFFRGGAKIDLKRNMSAILDTGHACHDGFRKYFLEAQELYRAQTSDPTGVNYVDRQKMITILEGRRGKSAQLAREQICEFMQKVREALSPLVEDLKQNLQIVINPEEIFKFDFPSESSKRLYNKPIKICIWEAYAFASAIAYEINRGFLYGGVVEISDEEYEPFLNHQNPPDESRIPF